jgi:hypothetical protein
MTIHSSIPKKFSPFCRAICAFGFLFALAAAPAYGQQVHQLLYNNSDWADQDLNGGISMTNGPVAAYLTTPNNQEHAYYLTGDGHVHQLFYNGTSWADEDLTVLSGGPPASGAVAGFSVGNFQYVYYVAQKSPLDVHQLLYNNVGWVDSDLTALSGAKTKATAAYGMVAFTTSPALHVYYQQYATGDIHQLFSTNGSTWQDQDLTTLTGAVPPSYLWSGLNIGNLQYVYYQDRNYDLHQMYYNNSSWSDADLTVTAKTPRPLISPVAAFVIPGTKKIRLYFPESTNSHLLQLASSNGTTWTSTDLTKKAKGPVPEGGGSIAAFATTPNDGIHVFYESGNHINQLYQPTPSTWANQDLTALTHGGTAVNFSRIAGFSLQNFQYVFYVAQ